MRRLWGAIARRLPAETATAIADAMWSVPLAVYRLSGRRLARSPQLFRAGVMRQRVERSRVSGMTTLTERAYFKWHAQEEITGSGAVVDLGSWLGSTTAALAMGLSANPRDSARQTKIHAYDLFRWDRWLAIHTPFTRLGPYELDESVRPEFELAVKRWRSRIAIHEGDLLQESWTEEPIELLLVDAMKSWELASHILRQFYPALVPASGYLIHQDFSHCFTPWIPLISYRLRDYLVPAHDIPRSESVVFRLERPLPTRSTDLELDRSSFDQPEIERAFAHWLAVTEPGKHSGLRAARILLAHYDGDAERAISMRHSLNDHGLLSEWHLNTLHAVMDPAVA